MNKFIMLDGREILVDFTSVESVLNVNKEDWCHISLQLKEALEFINSEEYEISLFKSFGMKIPRRAKIEDVLSFIHHINDDFKNITQAYNRLSFNKHTTPLQAIEMWPSKYRLKFEDLEYRLTGQEGDVTIWIAKDTHTLKNKRISVKELLDYKIFTHYDYLKSSKLC